MHLQTFSDKVKQYVRTIPPGTVMSYQAVAKAVGHPKAHRAVANVMANNYDKTVPCHRVIRADGSIGNYNRGGPAQKYILLKNEGAIL